jgi:hypothetical protein
MKRLKWEELKMGEGLYNSAHLIFHESKELCIKKHVKPLCGNVGAEEDIDGTSGSNYELPHAKKDG